MRIVGSNELRRIRRRGRQRIVAKVVRLKNRPHPIVARLLKRVVFVIVATGTVDREAEERFGRMLNDIVEPHVSVELVPVPREEPRRPQRSLIVRRHFVGSEHLDNHSVVALVLVQRLDNPVPPPPDVLATVADFFPVAGRIAVPPDVHEVPGPAFAVPWTVEQPVDGVFKSCRRFVFKERLSFFRCRWQAGQRERGSPQQHRPGGFSDGGDSETLVLVREESVDVVSNPRCRNVRHLRLDRGKERPVPRRGFGNRLVGSHGPARDPGRKPGGLRPGQSRAGIRRRHPIVVVRGHSLQQETLRGRAFHEDRPVVSPLFDQARRIQPEPAFLFAGTVARKTLIPQQRLDIRHVVDGTCFFGRQLISQRRPLRQRPHTEVQDEAAKWEIFRGVHDRPFISKTKQPALYCRAALLTACLKSGHRGGGL